MSVHGGEKNVSDCTDGSTVTITVDYYSTVHYFIRSQYYLVSCKKRLSLLGNFGSPLTECSKVEMSQNIFVITSMFHFHPSCQTPCATAHQLLHVAWIQQHFTKKRPMWDTLSLSSSWENFTTAESSLEHGRASQNVWERREFNTDQGFRGS